MGEKKIIIEAPDKYGLPTDDELRAEIEAEYERRKAQRDADYKKADDERVAKEKKEQELTQLKAKAEEIIKELGKNPTFEDAFDKLVPNEGACESLGAELIRAVNRLEYRWWNDGDRFFEGYGLETCGSPAAFICDNVEPYGKISNDDIDMIIRNTADDNVDGDDYTEFTEELKDRILELVVKEHPELLATPLGDKDIHSWTDGEEYWYEYIPRYEWEIDVSEKINDYLNRDDIDSWGIIGYLEEFLDSYGYDNYFRDCNVSNPWGYRDKTYYIYNLTKEDYDELNNIDKEDFWYDLEKELEDEFGPIVDESELEDIRDEE